MTKDKRQTMLKWSQVWQGRNYAYLLVNMARQSIKYAYLYHIKWSMHTCSLVWQGRWKEECTLLREGERFANRFLSGCRLGPPELRKKIIFNSFQSIPKSWSVCQSETRTLTRKSDFASKQHTNNATKNFISYYLWQETRRIWDSL